MRKRSAYLSIQVDVHEDGTVETNSHYTGSQELVLDGISTTIANFSNDAATPKKSMLIVAETLMAALAKIKETSKEE